MDKTYRYLGSLPGAERLQMCWPRQTQSDQFFETPGERRVEPAAIDHVRDHHPQAGLSAVVCIGLKTASDIGDREVVIDQVNLCFLVAHNGIFPLINTYRCKLMDGLEILIDNETQTISLDRASRAVVFEPKHPLPLKFPDGVQPDREIHLNQQHRMSVDLIQQLAAMIEERFS